MNKIIALLALHGIITVSSSLYAMTIETPRPPVELRTHCNDYDGDDDDIRTIPARVLPQRFYDPRYDSRFAQPLGYQLQLPQQGMRYAAPKRFIMVVEAIPDKDGNPVEIKRIVGTHLVEGNAALKLGESNPAAKKNDEKAEAALSLCEGLKELTVGLKKVVVGCGIIIIITGQTGAPYVVDMAKKIAYPLLKKLGLADSEKVESRRAPARP